MLSAPRFHHQYMGDGDVYIVVVLVVAILAIIVVRLFTDVSKCNDLGTDYNSKEP